MASRRRIKKEIDYVVSDLILDCFTYANLYQKPNDEESLKIVQDILTLRNELRNQANHPETRAENVSAKSYYDMLAETLIKGVDDGYNRLGKLISQQPAKA